MEYPIKYTHKSFIQKTYKDNIDELNKLTKKQKNELLNILKWRE